MTIDESHTRTTGASTADGIAAEAADQASRLAGSVRDEVTRREQDLRSGIAQRAESVAAGLRKAGSEIDPDSTLSTMFDRAADSVSSAADTLKSTDPAQMVDEIRGFARRQPGAFLGLSALAGFAAMRFLRAGATPSAAPAMTGGFSDPGVIRRTPSGDSARVSPAGAASGTTRPIPSGGLPVAGTRGDGGSHA